MAQKTTIQEFESVFPKLEEVLVEHAQSYKLPAQALEWYKKVGGRKQRGNKTRPLTAPLPLLSPSKSMPSAASATAACRCRTRRRCCLVAP